MAKLKGRPQVHSNETIAEVYRLWDTGDYGYLRISKMLGISKSTVYFWIKRRKLESQNS